MSAGSLFEEVKRSWHYRQRERLVGSLSMSSAVLVQMIVCYLDRICSG